MILSQNSRYAAVTLVAWYLMVAFSVGTDR
jgi:hypothetical protein